MGTESHYSRPVRPTWVRPIAEPPFPLLKARGQRARAGLKYEAKVHDYLLDRFGIRYFPSQWWAYAEGDRTHHCQTDGILIDERSKRLVLFEVKLSHTPTAYWQMENLYIPILQRWLRATPGWIFCTIEVVKWYDCAVACPRRPRLIERIEDARPGDFAVHIWH